VRYRFSFLFVFVFLFLVLFLFLYVSGFFPSSTAKRKVFKYLFTEISIPFVYFPSLKYFRDEC